MAFSTEWEKIYSQRNQLSIWPWSDLVSLSHRYCNLHEGMKVLELGCGAGANIPYFLSLGAEYYGIDGSETIINKLRSRFNQSECHFVCGDFTKDFCFNKSAPNDEKYDICVDRSAVTTNSTLDIENVIERVLSTLKPNGTYIGIDWFSISSSCFSSRKDIQELVDENTAVFSDGYFKNMGRVHFSDEKHIMQLFSRFSLVFLREKKIYQKIPKEDIISQWDFVAKKI